MKKMRLSVTALALAGVLVVGAAAATTVRNITAQLRPDITVEINGKEQTMRDVNGGIVYPVTYNGTTYLPIRAIGEALGRSVDWDGRTQTVSLSDWDQEAYPEISTISEAEDRIDELEREIKALKPAATYSDRARQYAALAGKLDALSDDLYDIGQDLNRQLRDGKVSYKDYNKQSARIDKVDTRIKAARDTLEDKTIADDTTEQTTAQAHLAALKSLESEGSSIISKIDNLKPASTYSQRVDQYDTYSGALDDLRSRVSDFYSDLNDDLWSLEISYKDYNSLSSRAGDLDVKLKNAMYTLQEKLFSDDGWWDDAYDEYDDRLNDLEERMDGLETKIANLKAASTSGERAKQYKAYMQELNALSDDVSGLYTDLNAGYRSGDITSKEYNSLSARANALDVRVKDAKAAVEKKVGDSAGSDLYDSYLDEIDKLSGRVDKQVKAAENFKPAYGWNSNKQAWRQLKKQIDALDDEIDELDDAIERDYKNGKLTRDEYNALERALDKVDDNLDYADDLIEDYFDD